MLIDSRMQEIRRRAHEYAKDRYMKNGCSLMRAYVRGSIDERENMKKIIRSQQIRVFLSGKVSGEEYYTAYRKFADAERSLETMGYIVINPMVVCAKHWSWVRCMIVCLWNLCRCRCVYQLEDWKHSRGARIEYRVARLLNKKILHG